MEDTNLFDGLNAELERAKELLDVYRSIPNGVFGAIIIDQTIEHAERSMHNNDVIEMIHAYKALQNLE